MHIKNIFKKNILKRTFDSNSFLKISNKYFTPTVEDINMPIIDIDKFLNKGENWERECKAASDSLHDTGIMIVRDSRAEEKDNKTFISMMEEYFYNISKDHYAGKLLKDAHPEHAYQHGVTPEYKEKARSHCEMYKKWPDENKPVSECPPVYDSKWRFFWFIGERNPEYDKDMLIYPNIIPDGFPQWEKVMNSWGNKLLSANETSAQMAAIGFSLPEMTFVEKMKYAGHLLAPTGSDLNKFSKETVFAGFHYDLNFLTIHGKSNYGGLYVWLRNGKKVKVKVPDGCLLLQAGAQFEYLTGGECLNGYHEVIYTDEVESIVDKHREENKTKQEKDKTKLWRVSSTLFSQIRQNVILEPLGRYRNETSIKKYPPILTRDQVAEELRQINLMTE